jgi:hypothetical protein
MKRRTIFQLIAGLFGAQAASAAVSPRSNAPAGVPFPVAPHKEWFEMTLRPNKDDERLYDLLVRRYRKGTTNPGQGTKLMSLSTFYAADRDGERIQRVRARLLDLYARYPNAERVSEEVRSVMFATLCHNASLRAAHANVKEYRQRLLEDIEINNAIRRDYMIPFREIGPNT